MPAKKKPDPPRTQIEQLRATVLKLRDKLEQEARQSKLHKDLAQAAQKARTEIAKQVAVLKGRAESLAKQLRGTIAEGAKKEQQVRAEALAKVAQLRKELALKTAEVKRKSAELSKLAMESAERARVIITESASTETTGEAPGTPKPPES
jgi:hypothetical protein